MSWVKYVFAAAASIGVSLSALQSDEQIGNLAFKLPTGWTKAPYRNQIVLRPGDQPPSVSCQVTITANLKASGDLVQWVNGQASEFLARREVLLNTPIPYQDDPKGWEGCGFSFAVRVNANTPTYYHMFIGFRRGDVAGTLHFVTDRVELTQKYQGQIGAISNSIRPAGGFGPTGTAGNPPPGNPTAPPTLPNPLPANPGNPPATIPTGAGAAAGPNATLSPTIYFPDVLPPPAAMPEGSVEAAAKSLAQRILKGGPEGLAALERAVLMSGFSIHELPGKSAIAAAPTPNGMSFADIDLIGANALMEWGASYDLGSLEKAFRGVKRFSQIGFLPLWKKSIENASGSARSNDRFYGALMKTLGTESKGGFSDFSIVKATDRLCPAQLYLLVWRSVGHIVAAKKDEAPVPSRGPSIGVQGSQADAVNSLTTLVDSFTMVDWTNVLAELVSKPDSAGIHDYLLAIARMQMILSETQWNVGLDEPRPLVRSKKNGETGEDRDLLVGVKWVPKKANWQKFNAAAKALGYSLDEVHTEGSCDVRYSGSGNDTIQPVPEKAVTSYQGVGGIRIYSVPIQGSPQKRRLPSNPEEERKKTTAEIVIQFVPGTGPGRVIRAENDVFDQVAIEAIWMPMSKRVMCEVPVKDWKPAGWQGTLAAGVTGSGNWQKGRSSGNWSVARRYLLNASFEKRANNMLVTRRPLPAGGHSMLPPEPIQGDALIRDSYFFKGPITNCLGETVGQGSITITWNSQVPANRVEVVGLQQTPIVEFDPPSNTYGIQFMNGQPYIPVIKKTVTVINGKSKTTIESMRMGLYSGVISLEKDHQKSRTVLDKKLPEEASFHDEWGVTLLDGFKGSERFMEGDVRVTLSWDISQGGGGESALRNIANYGLVALGLLSVPGPVSREMAITDEAPVFEGDAMASCQETQVRIQGQLSHVTDRSRPKRYRSSR